jgi:hypothetical protein
LITCASACALACAGTLAVSSTANADVYVRVEGPRYDAEQASAYSLEVEPHFTFGPGNVYGDTGFGAGLRLGIPLVAGHIGSVPDNLALSFGPDVVHYDNCYYGGYCGANYLMFPVAAQWNLFVARRVSVFGEGGLYAYKGWFTGCGPGDVGCSAPSDFGVLPTLAIGGRIHLGDTAALTLRLGYPTTTLGVSFM